MRFGYDDGPAVLDGIDATIPAGSFTAVVGPSGAGKSTLLKLLGRFFDATEGSIRIGGRDVHELGSAGASPLTAQVFQDVYLFEGTIADNLRVAALDASDADLDRVARVARLDEIVERLPDGWHTRVGEAGSTLSVGEKQPVSIARALLKDTPIVLLDGGHRRPRPGHRSGRRWDGRCRPRCRGRGWPVRWHQAGERLPQSLYGVQIFRLAGGCGAIRRLLGDEDRPGSCRGCCRTGRPAHATP
ncbi:ATP-binding cassette domain-containing protein [Nonomuraea longispora]|uniref:ATP-binding cassette domain-containing protein n=1 Tax=Nonomuraea longispora TaxID=1848320 RepID=UPI001C70A2D4|nr:ATP-binding cassette domain-containing protein [Nonomuraea longispora]